MRRHRGAAAGARPPYRILGGQAFYDKKQVKDALAYLKVMLAPQDDLATRRALDVPSRGVGLKTIEHLSEFARHRNLSLAEAIHRSEEIADIPAARPPACAASPPRSSAPRRTSTAAAPRSPRCRACSRASACASTCSRRPARRPLGPRAGTASSGCSRRSAGSSSAPAPRAATPATTTSSRS
ncbi:3'-5' exonuclease [Nannocystis pusilla]|uniref:3'-5' exonuclease n=1 Tax=Nannocystis pusilla TaxID=889268 RepID=UPI003B7F0CE7